MSARRKLPPWLAPIIALCGGAVYLALSWYFSHTQASVLDEGLYLYKGWLFATGQYTPFQDYGPWSNHMPLSFLLPGWVQLLFGPGLRTGRMLAVATGLFSLLGLWLLARRFGGGWWGAAAVWAVALNPAMVKIFSIQASQGLAASLLLWALVLTLGPGRPIWQLALGGALAGALPLTRINLLPVLPFLILYVYWGHSRRGGHVALASGSLVFLLGHAFFWPGILRMWSPWFPKGLTPFLDAYRRPPNEGGLWSPQMGFFSRALSFLQGLRFHFVALLAVLGAALAWPRRERRQSSIQSRTTVFLLSLFGLLFVLHAWASLGQDYCVFCFPVYLSFFSLIGLILLPLSFRDWSWTRPAARWMPLAIVLLSAGAGYGAFDTLGAGLLDQRAVVQLLKVELPRTSAAGTIPLWGLLENKYGLDYESIVRQSLLWGRMALSTLVGILGAALILGAARCLRRWSAPFPQKAYSLLLAAGLLFSPSVVLGGGYRTYDCSGDVIAAYEAAGAWLADAIPPDARVYWGTGDSPVPLLYLDGIRIYPSQLNGAYSYKFGGDPDALARFGHWNEALARGWAAEADAILLSPAVFKDETDAWLVSLVTGDGFSERNPTPPVHPCDPDSQILIFVRE